MAKPEFANLKVDFWQYPCRLETTKRRVWRTVVLGTKLREAVDLPPGALPKSRQKLQNRPAEVRQIVRTAAGDVMPIHDHWLILPDRPGVDQVIFDAW